ncbi:MAG TPA: hypothetical protein VIZ20_05495 [Streptosporangiaceae bacterium]
MSWAVAAVALCAFLVAAFAVVPGHHPAATADSQIRPATTAPARNQGSPDGAAVMIRQPVMAQARPATAKPVPATTRASSSPTASPTPASTAAAPSSSLVPQATAEYETPQGSNELAWSEAILKGLGDPITSANVISLGYWMQNEAGSPPYGIVGANNPLNVSQPGYGGTPIKSEGGGYSLYSYPSVQDGVDATVAYLNNGAYSLILAALKAGEGLSSSSLADEIGTYSGHGYTTIPDSWGSSQGQPETP